MYRLADRKLQNLEVIAKQNEVELVKRCKKGDAKAQYRLYKLYSKGMYNVAVRMTGNRNLAEDVLQDAFIKAFTEIQKLKSDKAFGGWLKRILINRCIDVLRTEKMIFSDIESLNIEGEDLAVEVDDEVDAEMIHELIKKLPEGARQILVMRALEGYKHAEIADKLGVSESTAKTQFFRAKQLLAQMINESRNEEGSGKNFKGEAIKA